MIVKHADPKHHDLEALQRLLEHPQATANQRSQIEQELRAMRSGIKGEAEAAYELNFYYGEKNNNWAVLHDLRVEHEGRVAQIDHLAINRLLEVWVCESKRFSEGVAVNHNGEFSAFYSGKPYGMPSPIEQNRKHCEVLDDIFSNGRMALPKRLGLTMRPKTKSLVLVSKNARIQRPKKATAGMEQIIKVDQFRSHIGKDMETTSPLLLAKVIASETLMNLAHEVANLHKPISFDWAGKFGLHPEIKKRDTTHTPEAAQKTGDNCQARGCGRKSFSCGRKVLS